MIKSNNQGEWTNDKRDGYGRYMYKDGTHYEGQVFNYHFHFKCLIQKK